MKFGLIGHPVAHSFSKKYFEEKFQSERLSGFTYTLLDAPTLDDVERILSQDYAGLNITIPHKVSVLPLLDELSEEAFLIGAVNTLVRTTGGRWKGYNTDAIGFSDSLCTWMEDSLPPKALILGDGGASRAVRFALDQLGVDAMIVSRNQEGDLRYDQLDQEIIHNHPLIIQSTSVGMSPDVDRVVPFPFRHIGPDHWLYDLIYNPPNTLFLALGQKAGAQTKNGLEMLHRQADHSWSIWKSYGTF